MQAGKLRHQITLEQNTGVEDTAGQVVDNWTPFATNLWASIRPLTGEEVLQAQQVQAEVTHEVKLRYLAGVTPQLRVLFGARVFNILSVVNTDERNYELVLLCKEQM
jgi:SPP1 family predicted phage head-tail adaptor